MRTFLSVAFPLSLLVACVDTTGLSAAIHTDVHPETSQNALVTVTEYADLQCPACQRAHVSLTKPLIEKYGTQIAYDFRHFPLASIHRHAMEAAESAECAADQGKFWEFLDQVYGNQQELSSNALRAWAKDIALNTDLFDRCVGSRIKRKAIQASYDEGRSKDVQGTPTYFVNGRQTNATFEDLSTAIDAALEEAAVLR